MILPENVKCMWPVLCRNNPAPCFPSVCSTSSMELFENLEPVRQVYLCGRSVLRALHIPDIAKVQGLESGILNSGFVCITETMPESCRCCISKSKHAAALQMWQSRSTPMSSKDNNQTGTGVDGTRNRHQHPKTQCPS